MKSHPGGVEWERKAERYLENQGLELLARNFHCRLGEVDLVMQEGETTVFIEVRHRARADYGDALASVTWHKQVKIIRTAGIFLTHHPELASRPCRFDVVAVGNHRWQTVTWLRNAFDASGV